MEIMDKQSPGDHSLLTVPLHPSSTNTTNTAAFGDRLQLSTAAETALPPSSPAQPPPSPRTEASHAATLGSNTYSPGKLRKTPSSSSLLSMERSVAPTFHKGSSLAPPGGARGSTPPRSPVPRRSSSNLSSLVTAYSAMPTTQSLSTPAEEHPAPLSVTAASVAKEYLEKELGVHNGLTKPEADVVVVLHDACYGHRFSRPRTSKANLNTIVERPERILATILGVSVAYVRLGGRHVGAVSAPYPNMEPSSITSIPFQLKKSSRIVSLLSPAVTQVHGTKWMAELKMMCEGAEAKLAMNGKELSRPSTSRSGDTDEERPRLHEGDLYLCSESLEALEGALGGVCEAVDMVFSNNGPKRAFVCVRPPGHHCSDSYPSGFCWLNNIHVGISHAAMTHGLTHAAIVDFDLHHGDGSQNITWAHNAKVAALPKNAPMSKRTSIGYFSLHDINSYPCEYGDEEKVRNASLCLENAHGQTIWNVHLQPWRSDAEFWELYEQRYSVLLEKIRAYLKLHTERLQSLPNTLRPKAAIFISAGFDASEWESHGMQRHKVNVPTDFYARFTQDISRLADEDGLGLDGRVISVLEGGYSDRALISGVLGHLSGLANIPEKEETLLGHGVGRRLGQISLDGQNLARMETPPHGPVQAYDEKWWSPPNLEKLDSLVNPPVVVSVATKKPRSAVAPTYTTATQSYIAKIVSPATNRRSMSGTISRKPSLSAIKAEAPTIPPPDVDWATASHELSKLLIPSDRQTKSCKSEDLNAEATRVRRSRQSGVDLPIQNATEDGKRMQLRDRKTRAPNVKTDDEDELRTVSRTSRRKTIGGAANLEKDAGNLEDRGSAPTNTQTRRRLSIASTVLSSIEDRIPDLAAGNAQGNANLAIRRRSSSSLNARSVSISSRVEPPLVKKTRASAKPRSPSKTRAPKRITSTPSLSRVPSSYSNQLSSVDGQPKSHNGEAEFQGTALLGTHSSNQQDVDQLATNMRKMSIKLRVPSKVEHDQREAQKKSGRKPALSKASKHVSAKIKKASVCKTTEPMSTSVAVVPEEPQSDFVPDLQSIQSETMKPSQSELKQPETLVNPISPEALRPLPATFMAPEFTNIPTSVLAQSTIPNPVTKERGSIAPAVIPSNYTTYGENPTPVPFVPVTNRPTTPRRTKNDLPIFTSTSPIIFRQHGEGLANINGLPYPPPHKEYTEPKPARPQNDEGKIMKREDIAKQEVVDMWGVPDTPQQHTR